MSQHQESFWGESDIEVVQRCPACGSTLSKKIHTELQDFLEGVPGVWDMYLCEKCESGYLNPRPKASAIGKAYGNYYTHTDARLEHEADNGDSTLWRLVNGYLNHRYAASRVPASSLGFFLIPLIVPLRQQLDYFFRYLPRTPGRVLDVGCGNGRFLLRALQAGWEVKGIEPDMKAAKSAQLAGVPVSQQGIEDTPGRGDFDVVTCSHVIEHVHDPLTLLRNVKSHLRPGGQLWLATPNMQSIGHWVFGADWRGLEPPRHMQILSRSALRTLLERAGFSEISFRCRGRGASFVFRESQVIARTSLRQHRRFPVWLVDLLASLFSNCAEELVVVARRPR